ncbi:MAG TPA: dTMP kinase [Longimicrobiales bacterium]|nr:dTMP kinase [Longimicrobiales bacterium]
MFIVLEGIEGSGKSTQARLLAERLEAAGRTVILTREPGGTQVGEEIRRALLHGGDDVPARTELLLMLAARAAFVDGIVSPALARGAVVISDRYEMSTFAYQGYGRGLSLDEVRQINDFATGGLRPDATVVLDLDVAEGEARRLAAGRTADRIERAGAGFHRKVAEAYRLLGRSEPGAALVHGSGAPEDVHASILRVLGDRFPETFGATKG